MFLGLGGHSVPSEPPAPTDLHMMRLSASANLDTSRPWSGSSGRLRRGKLPLAEYHRLSVRTERARLGLDRSKCDQCLAFLYDFFEFFSGRRVAGQKVRKSVFSCLRHSRDHVQRARAVLTSPGATPEAQGARRSGRTEVGARGLSARRNPRVGKGVNVNKTPPPSHRGAKRSPSRFTVRLCPLTEPSV